MLLSDFRDPFVGLNVVSAKGEIGEISYIDPDNVISSDGEGPAIKISWRNGKARIKTRICTTK